MTFKMICKKIHSTAAEELAVARSGEQKELVFVAALQEYDRTAVGYLRALCQKEGTDSPAYLEARETATQLLAALALPFLSCCTSYKHGISIFENLAQNSPDQALSRRCTIYATQLKRRWNETDPSALPINPRGKVAKDSPEPRTFPGGFLLLFPVAVLLLAYFFLKSPLLNQTDRPPEKQKTAAVPVSGEELQQEPEAPPLTQAPPGPAPDEYFSYTDKHGVIHLENRPAQRVSAPSAADTANPGNLTPVTIRGNQVLVPVTLSHRGRFIKVNLLLDTGATTTTISERCAASLGLDRSRVETITATVADGRQVPSSAFVADSIAVGPFTNRQVRTLILPGSGGAEYEGLLGMDFLKNRRYHVDFSRNVIEWGT